MQSVVGTMPGMVDLANSLHRIFGFTAFRPGQEAVVRDALAGRDVIALMPTGGGKSLCFQLSALLQPLYLWGNQDDISAAFNMTAQRTSDASATPIAPDPCMRARATDE